jgi:hypothetical protein
MCPVKLLKRQRIESPVSDRVVSELKGEKAKPSWKSEKRPEGRPPPTLIDRRVDGAGPPSAREQRDQTASLLPSLRLPAVLFLSMSSNGR